MKLGKRLPLWQKTTEDGTKRQAQSLPPSVQYWKRAGSRAHQVSGKRQKPVLLWVGLCSRRRSSKVSLRIWKRKCGKRRRGITTDFAKKARSQLIKEGNFMVARALNFLVCGAATNLTCLRINQFPTNFSVFVVIRELWPPGSMNCGNVLETA